MKLKWILWTVLYLMTTSIPNANADPFHLHDTLTITVASEPDYPPFCMVDEQGNPYGFSIDLIKAAAKVRNIHLHFHVGPWFKIKQDLADGSVDALPMVGRTPERDSLYDFTIPYITLHGAIFVRKNDHSINTVNDLKGKHLLVMKGDNAEEFVRRNAITHQITTTNTFEEAFRLLSEGTGDAVIIQKVLGLELLKSINLRNITALDILLDEFEQEFCFAVKKGNQPLLNELNEGLAVIIANNTYEELHAKWFGPEVNMANISRKVVSIVIPAIFIITIVSIITLRRQVRRRTRNLRIEFEMHQVTLSKLNQQKVLLERMEQMILVGGWEYDGNLRQLTVSRGFCNIFGLTDNEILPAHFIDSIHFVDPSDKRRIVQVFYHSLGSGAAIDLEVEVMNNGPGPRIIRITGSPETDQAYSRRIAGAVMDITEQRTTERELILLKDDLEEMVKDRTRQLEEKIMKLRESERAMLYMVEDLNYTTSELKVERQKLEMVNKELESFSYSVSHDLRAPLRGIHGFTDILIQEYGDKLDDEGKRLGQIIKKNALDMGKLIDDLLSFSRLGRQALNESLIDMEHLVQSVIVEVQGLYTGNRHEIIIGNLEPCIGDFSMIRVVMVNLISNAFKFSSRKEQPVIEISSERKDHKVVYTIRDNGAGFDMKYKDKLFGVFQRLHTVREFEGIGVGLANCKRIITRHGGEIDAEGNPGSGARFWFTLRVH